MPLRVKHSEALDTIERLDLTQESLGWQSIELEEKLQPKGCFIMYPISNIQGKNSL